MEDEPPAQFSEMLYLTSVKNDHKSLTKKEKIKLFRSKSKHILPNWRESLDDELFATTLCNTWPRLVDRNMHSETCQLAGICKS